MHVECALSHRGYLDTCIYFAVCCMAAVRTCVYVGLCCYMRVGLCIQLQCSYWGGSRSDACVQINACCAMQVTWARVCARFAAWIFDVYFRIYREECMCIHVWCALADGSYLGVCVSFDTSYAAVVHAYVHVDLCCYMPAGLCIQVQCSYGEGSHSDACVQINACCAMQVTCVRVCARFTTWIYVYFDLYFRIYWEECMCIHVWCALADGSYLGVCVSFDTSYAAVVHAYVHVDLCCYMPAGLCIQVQCSYGEGSHSDACVQINACCAMQVTCVRVCARFTTWIYVYFDLYFRIYWEECMCIHVWCALADGRHQPECV